MRGIVPVCARLYVRVEGKIPEDKRQALQASDCTSPPLAQATRVVETESTLLLLGNVLRHSQAYLLEVEWHLVLFPAGPPQIFRGAVFLLVQTGG